MTVCPIAIVASCKQCPAVSMCPLKSLLGDYSEEDAREAMRDNPAQESGDPEK